MAKSLVEGELYQAITGQLFEIGRQLRQPNGYPYNPVRLKQYLQNAIEGRFHYEMKTRWNLYSAGQSGSALVSSIREKCWQVGEHAMVAIRSTELTNGKIYRIAVFGGYEFSPPRTMEGMIKEARGWGFKLANVEAAALLAARLRPDELFNNGTFPLYFFHAPIRADFRGYGELTFSGMAPGGTAPWFDSFELRRETFPLDQYFAFLAF